MLRHVFWRPNLVLVVEPPVVCVPATWLIARLAGARAWLHIQDFEVDAAFDLGLVKGQGIRRAVATIERWMMRRMNRVSTISTNMLIRLEEKGVTGGVLFPNWVDTSAIFPMAKPSSFRQELGIPGETVVALYSGNMGRKQGLELLAQVAVHFMKSDKGEKPEMDSAGADVLFVFCGAGAGRAELEAACAGLPNVLFLDLQPIERLNDLLNCADIHLLPQRADAADLVMPSKLTGMMASGRPTVATAQEGTEIAKVLKDSGYIVSPGDVSAFCNKLTQLANNKESREKMGKAARSYAEEFLARERVLSRFQEELKACIAGK
jgi:colanic acid biosynthesis glycosyl transferase WcaI